MLGGLACPRTPTLCIPLLVLGPRLRKCLSLLVLGLGALRVSLPCFVAFAATDSGTLASSEVDSSSLIAAVHRISQAMESSLKQSETGIAGQRLEQNRSRA